MAERRSRLEQYLREQVQALLEAYRLLYEGKDFSTLPQQEFQDLVFEADEKIMDPFYTQKKRAAGE